MKTLDPQERDASARILAWLAAVDQASSEAWTEIQDLAEIPAQVRADSEFFCDHIFTPAANPHDACGVRRALHQGGIHLLRHTYDAGGLALSVLEGRNFVLVRVARASLDVVDTADHDALTRVAARIFQAPPRFDACELLHEGTLLCSSSADPLSLDSCRDRIDGGVRDGEVWFLCYKRCAQRLGFAHAGQWFDDSRHA